MAQGSKLVVYAALAANVAIAVAKFAAAALTGSSAMLSEGVHSLVDSGNEVLLLYGLKRAAKKPDETHPLGYGRELYFWSFVVALLIFAVGAGVSIYEGIAHLQHPEPIESPRIAFLVLGVSFLFEGASWAVALREFRAKQGGRSWWRAFRASKDPPSFMVLFEDSAALAGLLVAAAGAGLSVLTGQLWWDGVASLLIGLILAVVAVLLARESKGLLIGERADPALSAAIMGIARGVPGVAEANGVVTVQLAPQQVVVTLSLAFDPALTTPAIEAAVAEMEWRVRAAHCEVTAIFVKPQASQQAAHAEATGLSGIRHDALEGAEGAPPA